MGEVVGISDRLQEDVGIKLITKMERALIQNFMADAASETARLGSCQWLQKWPTED